MSLHWSDPPPPTAFDHPGTVAADDDHHGITRCRQGCVATAIVDPHSDTESRVFTCHGCGGGVCLGCRTTPTSFPGMFCTYCTRAHAEHWAGLVDEDAVPMRTPITVGQLRKLLEGVADDVPLMATTPPSLKTRSQCFDIVVARPSLHETEARLGLELRAARRPLPRDTCPLPSVAVHDEHLRNRTGSKLSTPAEPSSVSYQEWASPPDTPA